MKGTYKESPAPLAAAALKFSKGSRMHHLPCEVSQAANCMVHDCSVE